MSYHYPHLVGKISDPRSSRDRVANLVRRYPRVTRDEAKEIVRFMRKGRHLDVGLLTADDTIRPQLDAFMKDHRSRFALKWSEATVLFSGIAALFGMLWLVRELFS
jgi:hypothetical protein